MMKQAKTEIGKGAFGTVYKTTNKKGNVIADKQIDVSDPRQRDMAKAEIKLMKQLEHENIVALLLAYYSPADQTMHLHLEYMAGGTLFTLMNKHRERGQLVALDAVTSYLEQCLSGLKYIHDRDIVHCDLKPANLLLSEDKSLIKISDFGISVKFDSDKLLPHWAGTTHYMAPEIYMNGVWYPESDMWSVGVIWFELIEGLHPFDAGMGVNLEQFFLNLFFVDVEMNSPRWQEELLQELIERMLRKTYDERPRCSEALKEARRIREQEESTKTVGKKNSATARSAEEQVKKRSNAAQQTGTKEEEASAERLTWTAPRQPARCSPKLAIVVLTSILTAIGLCFLYLRPESSSPRPSQEFDPAHDAAEMAKWTELRERNCKSCAMDERSLLHYVASKGEADVVRVLLRNGAKVNQVDAERSTALHLAARTGFLEVCKVLLQNGAKVNVKDATGSTPLHLASHYGSTSPIYEQFVAIIRLLLSHNANKTLRDNRGATPLLRSQHAAVKHALS